MSRSFYNLGLTGCPLEKSKSPALHKAALRASGLNGDYRLYLVQPGDHVRLASLVQRLRDPDGGQSLHGLNVTIPHKQAVIPLLDSLTPTARAIGAVNTITWQSGELVGDNTDAPGFLLDLKRLAYPALGGSPGHALVLGAGGSARAVVYALLQDGWTVTIAARRIGQARQLGEALLAVLQGGIVEAVNLAAQDLTRTPHPNLVVNTTPVGMIPEIDRSPWPEGLPFYPGMVVYDLVYKPPQTCLMRKAGEAGFPAFNGLGMLVEQAALAFERWTGTDADRGAMWQAVSDNQG